MVERWRQGLKPAMVAAIDRPEEARPKRLDGTRGVNTMVVDRSWRLEGTHPRATADELQARYELDPGNRHCQRRTKTQAYQMSLQRPLPLRRTPRFTMTRPMTIQPARAILAALGHQSSRIHRPNSSPQ